MSDEKPIPWSQNDRAQRVYDELKAGARSTLDLHQKFLIHPARQIWELRHWYGFTIRTHRLENRVALYELVEE